jgi:hypothetical protein
MNEPFLFWSPPLMNQFFRSPNPTLRMSFSEGRLQNHFWGVNPVGILWSRAETTGCVCVWGGGVTPPKEKLRKRARLPHRGLQNAGTCQILRNILKNWGRKSIFNPPFSQNNFWNNFLGCYIFTSPMVFPGIFRAVKRPQKLNLELRLKLNLLIKSFSAVKWSCLS